MPPSKPRAEGYSCPLCKDMGLVYVADRNGEPIWEQAKHGKQPKVRKCDCRTEVNDARRYAYLLSIDGLSPRERTLTFDALNRTATAPAIERVEADTRKRSGFVTLTGKPGTGKTTLLICAVNAARERNVPAVYAVMSDLLDYLRAAYNPANTSELSFDARWDLLLRAEVLAIDEVDQFNATPWAMERFLKLIDERWRMMDSRLTLLATNLPPVALPDKVYSRARDGRAAILSTGGPDMRPYLGNPHESRCREPSG